MTEPAPRPPWLDPLLQWLDLVVRGFGVVVALWGSFILAAYGAFLSAFRVGSTLVPLSLPLVVVGNVALIWFAYRVTEHKLLGLSPGILWVLVTFVWSNRTSEGDLVLYQSNWVATAYLLVGSATVGIYAYRLIIPRRRGPTG